jgi:hypothetical protein
MLKDILEGNDKVIIESPNEKMIGILKKLKLVDEEGTSTGRVSFITCM